MYTLLKEGIYISKSQWPKKKEEKKSLLDKEEDKEARDKPYLSEEEEDRGFSPSKMTSKTVSFKRPKRKALF